MNLTKGNRILRAEFGRPEKTEMGAKKKGPAENCSTTHLESQLRSNRFQIRATVLRDIAAGISRPDHRNALLAIALEYDGMVAAGDNRAKEILQMFRARPVRL